MQHWLKMQAAFSIAKHEATALTGVRGKRVGILIISRSPNPILSRSSGHPYGHPVIQSSSQSVIRSSEHPLTSIRSSRHLLSRSSGHPVIQFGFSVEHPVIRLGFANELSPLRTDCEVALHLLLLSSPKWFLRSISSSNLFCFFNFFPKWFLLFLL